MICSRWRSASCASSRSFAGRCGTGGDGCSWTRCRNIGSTCPAQLELVALLAGPDGNVCCVGDTDQCIFSFRQADPGGMRRLAERFPGHRRVALSRNRRSRAEIVATACRCVEHNPGREPVAQFAVRGPGGLARAIALGSDRDEADWITRQVAAALADGCPPAEIWIVARASYATAVVQEVLRHRGIPHRVLGSLGLYERAEVRDALAYLTLLANPRDVQAFCRAVCSPRRGVGPAAQSGIVALARERHGGDLIGACSQPAAAECVRGRAGGGEALELRERPAHSSPRTRRRPVAWARGRQRAHDARRDSQTPIALPVAVALASPRDVAFD